MFTDALKPLLPAIFCGMAAFMASRHVILKMRSPARNIFVSAFVSLTVVVFSYLSFAIVWDWLDNQTKLYSRSTLAIDCPIQLPDAAENIVIIPTHNSLSVKFNASQEVTFKWIKQNYATESTPMFSNKNAHTQEVSDLIDRAAFENKFGEVWAFRVGTQHVFKTNAINIWYSPTYNECFFFHSYW